MISLPFPPQMFAGGFSIENRKKKASKEWCAASECYKSRRVGCEAGHYAHEVQQHNISLAALFRFY